MKSMRFFALFCLSIVSIFLFNQTFASPGKMRMYACYSPTHEVLFKDWFLPSIKDDYELIVEQHEQYCSSAVYMSDGWTNATLKKVDMIVKAIKDNWGKVFVYSDVDIQFFRPTKDILLKALDGKDMVIQRDSPQGIICTGFFACRANNNTLKIWQEVQRLLSDKSQPPSDDQIVFNTLIGQKKFPLVWNFLPVTFLSGGTLTGRHWNVGDTLPIPKDIVLHHANWTLHGVKNKIEELRYVRKEVLKEGDPTNERKVRLYACYSPTREGLLKDWFLPSIKDDYDVIVEHHEQLCPSALYMSDGWTNATLKKVDMIVKAIKENWGDVFVYSDVDIQFFRPTKDILLDAINGLDMVIQRDNPSGLLCTGFFACRANERTLAIWQEVQRLLSDKEFLKNTPLSDDQSVFNKLLKENQFPLIFDYLPARFLSGGTLTGTLWNVGDKLIIPENIVLHHANWTINGVKNKIEELLYVRTEVLGK